MSEGVDREERKRLGEKLQAQADFPAILELIDTLIGPDGCPWDREQTVENCPKYLRNEVQEVIGAIESGDNENLEEELGDLLFLVAFTSKLGEKETRVSMDGVFRRILKKMIFRHPHVFGGDMDAENPEEVLANWQHLKELEKLEKESGE
jgi:tetrapyrrole methylase family protein/MazG family protein